MIAKRAKQKDFLAIRRAISLNETIVYFVEITTGEHRQIQQIYIYIERERGAVDTPLPPEFVYLKRVFLHACNNSTSY